MTSDSTPLFNLLTPDLTTEILVRLPVKSILRCKSVSKPWLSLISSPNFVKSHLKHTLTSPSAPHTLTLNGGGTIMPLLHLDSREIGASPGDFSSIAGCANGIVCFRHASDFSRIKNPNIYLWNPAIKLSKLIPKHNIQFEQITMVSIGFGFDPVGNDYKVVVLLSCFDEGTAEVYSANANVWRRVEPCLKDVPFYDDFDVCVNGFLCCEGFYGMLAFDLNKKIFISGITLPKRHWSTRITDFDDCIAVIAYKEESNEVFNLWKLDDEACLRNSGVEASWTLMFCVDFGRPVHCVFGYFNSGDFLLCTEEDNAWILFNYEKKEVRNVPVDFSDRLTLKYNESLVSISGFKQVNWNAWEDDY